MVEFKVFLMYPDDLPRGARAAILAEQQGHRCCYCGVRFSPEMPEDIRLYYDPRPSVEHVIRIADGGSKTWENEVAACRGCNSARGDMPAHDYYELVRRGDLDALRRALRTSVSAKRRSRETLRKLGPDYRVVRQKGKWPPVIGELAMTPARERYFEEVYGVWAQEPKPAPELKVLKSAGREVKFVEVAGIKALRWNVRSV